MGRWRAVGDNVQTVFDVLGAFAVAMFAGIVVLVVLWIVRWALGGH